MFAVTSPRFVQRNFVLPTGSNIVTAVRRDMSFGWFSVDFTALPEKPSSQPFSIPCYIVAKSLVAHALHFIAYIYLVSYEYKKDKMKNLKEVV